MNMPYQKILVPHDFSRHSEAALAEAVRIAQAGHAAVHLVHVLQPPAYSYAGYMPYAPAVHTSAPFESEDLEECARECLHRIVEGQDPELGPFREHVVVGSDIAREISSVSRSIEADLIVMGTHGRTGLSHVFLGSVAERTLRSAPCPVLSVHCEDGEARDHLVDSKADRPESGSEGKAPQVRGDGYGAMETLHEAVERMQREGYRETFRAQRGGLLRVDEVDHQPERLVVDEVVRFEGASDPGDSSVLFALRTPEGNVRGTFSSPYGAEAGPENAEVLHRIDLRETGDSSLEAQDLAPQDAGRGL